MPNDTAQKIAYNLVFDTLLKLNNESHKLDDEALLDVAFTLSAAIAPLVSALEEIVECKSRVIINNYLTDGYRQGVIDIADIAAKALREVQE